MKTEYNIIGITARKVPSSLAIIDNIKRKNREGGRVMERECRGKTIRDGGKPDFLTDFIFPPSLLVVPLLPMEAKI